MSTGTFIVEAAWKRRVGLMTISSPALASSGRQTTATSAPLAAMRDGDRVARRRQGLLTGGQLRGPGRDERPHRTRRADHGEKGEWHEEAPLHLQKPTARPVREPQPRASVVRIL